MAENNHEHAPNRRAGGERFRDQHSGDVLMAQVKQLFRENGAIIPPLPMSMRAQFAFLDHHEIPVKHAHLYKRALEDIFRVVY
jgi:hypothetical protein